MRRARGSTAPAVDIRSAYAGTSALPATNATLDIGLQLSESGKERLVSALRNGVRRFVIVSRDGSVSANVELGTSEDAKSHHSIAGLGLTVDWVAGTIEREVQCTRLLPTELRLLAALLHS